MSLRNPVSETDHSQGAPNAAIQLLEYGDYQCPYCGRAYPIVKEIQRNLGKDLRFIFRNFPLTQIHPQAQFAAIACEAAALQDKYWEMHDMLFENQMYLDPYSITGYAQALQLDPDVFETDISDQALEDRVHNDFYGGMRSGVNATPTFFVNGEKYTGSWEFKPFLDYLQSMI